MPVGIGVVVLVATLLMAWAMWDRIPDQVPLHTGADGQVTRWGEKTVTNVLMAPLVGGGAILLSMAIMLAVMSVSRPRPSTGVVQDADSLGTMIRQAATMTVIMRSLSWSLLAFLVVICALEIPRWISGYHAASPVWLFGLATLAVVVLPVLMGRQVRPMIEQELAALAVPLGPGTGRELHAWRFVTVVDDPDAPLWIPFDIPRSNYTVNIAKPAGKVLAAGLVLFLLTLAGFLLLTPVLLPAQ